MSELGTRQSREAKTLYIPYMSDHGLVVAAALEAYGLPVVAMPPPDAAGLIAGLDLCRGRECLPCFLVVGDVIQRFQEPGFDPSRASLLIPTTGGLCRLGQYAVLLKQLLDDHGLGAVEIVSPSAENSYHGFGEHGTALRRLIWQGAVAVDALQKLLYQSRPYELERGAADAAYRASLDEVLAAVRAGGDGRLIAAMRSVAARFSALPLDRSEPRPLIGMVGEIYVRLNPFSNQEIVRQIEGVGGEVTVATMTEWLYFTNWLYAQLNWTTGKYLTFAGIWLGDRYQRFEEKRIVAPVKHLLRDPYETPTAALMAHLSPHYEPVLGLETEAGISIGKAIELARHGAHGIVNVMPFNCMPGIVVAGMAPRFRSDVVDIPWLDISFDAQGATNITTRLEAFIYQARQHQRRNGAAPATMASAAAPGLSGARMAARTAPLPARPGRTSSARQPIWSRRAMLARLGVVVAALVVAPVLALTPGRPLLMPERVTLGVTFSPKYAASLGLDPRTTFSRLLNALPISDVRLPLYWDEVERQPGVYELAAAEAYVAEAARHGVTVVPVLGYKVPRWPECHPPEWARDRGVTEKRAAILNLIRAEMGALRVYSNVGRWQIENEPFFPFGECDGFTVLDESFVAQEVALARQLDTRPIVITESGELSPGISALRAGDHFGISVYRSIWFEQVGLIRYPLVPEAYVVRERLARAVAGVEGESIVSELQAEPWFASGGSVSDVPLDRQLAMFPPGALREHVQFARQTGASTIHLWGVEWWYWMDLQGYPQYVNTMQELIEEVGRH